MEKKNKNKGVSIFVEYQWLYRYMYPLKQGNYYPYPIRICENCGYPQNIYPLTQNVSAHLVSH